MQTAKEKTKYIYVVITQTGTILSKILKLVTGAEYNHSSISFDPTLKTMYSFGRLRPYNPFFGGYVQESIYKGTFKRFSGTDAMVLAIPVEEEKWKETRKYLTEMYKEKKRYKYNYLGLFLAGVHINHTSDNRYYCSEFVKDVLVRFEIVDKNSFEPIVKPMDFVELSNAKNIYQGKLRMFHMY